MANPGGTGDGDGAATSGVRVPTRPHRVSLEVVPPVPAELPVGTSVSFKVRVSGTDADLRGARVEVVASEYLVATPALAEHGDGFTETATIAVRAPTTLGTYALVIVFPRQQIGRDVFEDCELPIAFETVPHKTSVAVWGVASPVAGRRPARGDGRGQERGRLRTQGGRGRDRRRGRRRRSAAAGSAMRRGRAPASTGPRSALAAPERTGTHSWRAAFPAQELKLAHDASGAAFGFAVVPPPEHRLTVRVTEADGAAPLAGVELALGPYRAATDAMGTARLDVPAGRFSLAVWKSGFEGAPIRCRGRRRSVAAGRDEARSAGARDLGRDAVACACEPGTAGRQHRARAGRGKRGAATARPLAAR